MGNFYLLRGLGFCLSTPLKSFQFNSVVTPLTDTFDFRYYQGSSNSGPNPTQQNIKKVFETYKGN